MELREIFKKKKVANLVIILMIALCFLLVGNFSKSPQSTDSIQQEDPSIAMEKRLEAILSQIKGAGKVSVLIVLDDFGEKEIATDQKQTIKEDSTDTENKAVLASSNPVVLKTTTPRVSGVVVASPGAGDEAVRDQLYRAVAAALPVLPHRIEIVEK